jgi:VWFA-related protein
MKLLCISALALALPLIAPAPGQAPGADQNSVPQADQDVVLRISVNLIQVDAVVTDSKGKHVADLEPGDFEVTQDGKPQKITHFSYVTTGTRQPAAPKYSAPSVRVANGKDVPPPPPVKIKPSDVKRTMAYVVDDLGLSFESIPYVRSALKKFVDQQMQPGDMVAVVRTSGGMGALQQFTTDKQLLYASIDKIKWNPLGRVGVNSFRAIGSEDTGTIAETNFSQQVFTVGTLGAIQSIVDNLKEYPGRKSLILFSDQMKMNMADGMGTMIEDAMLKLTDDCNRASVVLYPIDPRGLQTLSLTAADHVTNTRGDMFGSQVNTRRDDQFDSQEGMHFLAEKTGGFFTFNTNNINQGINNVLTDMTGYYLIGWNPGGGTFDSAKAKELYHRIKIRVKRPGLTVRTRDGFYGNSDEGTRPSYKTPGEGLEAAISSPFSPSDVRLRLTALFGNKGEKGDFGSYVTSYLHIDAKDLTFTDDADGKKQLKLNILLITYGDNGEVLDTAQQDLTPETGLTPEQYKKVLQVGFVYKLDLPVRKAGFYQMRAAVRDANSGKIGSATQFIEVPDVKKGKLTLSGIILKDRTVAEETPFVRIFKPGEELTYALEVINARTAMSVETQVRLFRDGVVIHTGRPMPLQTSIQTDPKHLLAGGVLRLGATMQPGDYQLQVVAYDKQARDKNNTATQWIDFEIAKP